MPAFERSIAMLKIAPSILAADFCALDTELNRVPNADWVHVDVMDGCFVPNITVGLPVVRSLRKHTGKFLDVHLMIVRPERWVERFAQAGADQVTFHLEAAQPPAVEEALSALERLGVKKGLVLRPITAPEAVLPWLSRLDTVLVMTVEPGFGGQKLIASQLDTIRRVRELIDRVNPACDLEIDGGVTTATAPAAIRAGANVLVAGSAVFGAPDPAAAIERLKSCV